MYAAVSYYIHGFYNQRRHHSTLAQLSPVDFEAAYRAAQEAVAVVA